MKMKFIMGAAYGLALLLTGCAGSETTEPTAVPLSKQVEYSVTIANAYSFRQDLTSIALAWDRNNIEASTRLAYLGMLLDKAERGELSLTDASGKPIDSADIGDYFYINDTMMMTQPDPPYNEYDTVVRSKRFNAEDIVELRFREDWTYDPKTLAITKKVIAMAPVFMAVPWHQLWEVPGSEKPVHAYFWVNFDKKSVPTHTLTNRIISNVTFKNIGMEPVKNIDSVAIEKYLSLLTSKLAADSLHCYTYAGGEIYDTLVTAQEFRDMQKKDKQFKNVTLLRFMEEWTFDITTMALFKKVVGVCPVVEHYDPVSGELMGYRPLFFVYFDDVWKPFNRKFKIQK